VSYIGRPPVPQFPCDDAAHALFCAARHAAHLAFIGWLNTFPDAADVDLEADGTCAVIRRLVALSRGAAS
jgi:hypothetical protein